MSNIQKQYEAIYIYICYKYTVIECHIYIYMILCTAGSPNIVLAGTGVSHKPKKWSGGGPT